MMTEKDILKQQQAVCDKYKTGLYPGSPNAKLGISKNFDSGLMPINGLRHYPTYVGEVTSGWYLWAGDYSEDPDFFEPMHENHLVEKYPSVVKFLSLPPGYRFQIDSKGYEDVWYDKSLLVKEGDLYSILLSYFPQHKHDTEYIEHGGLFGIPYLLVSDILLTNVIDKHPSNTEDLKSIENLINDLWGSNEITDEISFIIKDSILDHIKGDEDIISSIHLHGKARERANEYLLVDPRPQYNSILFK